MSTDATMDYRFQRDCEAAWNLGPRALCELLSEIGAAKMCRRYIEDLTAQYAAINPDALKVAGGDKFPPRIIREVTR